MIDLGLPYQHNPSELVVTGGQINSEQIERAKTAGVTTIVNLRAEEERGEYADEQAKVEAAGMTYVHMPVSAMTGEGLTADNARKLADLVGKGEPMVVHCKAASRVGALFALKAGLVDGLPVEQAIEEGRKAGLASPGLEQLARDLLENVK